MEVAVRAKPPPPKPKPKPKPNGVDNPGSGADQEAPPLPPSSSQYEVTADANVAAPPPRPASKTLKNGTSAPVSSEQPENGTQAEAPPRPRVVKKKAPVQAPAVDDGQPAQADVKPAVKKPAVKKTTANGPQRPKAADGTANGESNAQFPSEPAAPIEDGQPQVESRPVKKPAAKKAPANGLQRPKAAVNGTASEDAQPQPSEQLESQPQAPEPRPVKKQPVKKAPANGTGQPKTVQNGVAAPGEDGQAQPVAKPPARKKVSANGQPAAGPAKKATLNGEANQPSTSENAPSASELDVPQAAPPAVNGNGTAPKAKPAGTKRVVKKTPPPPSETPLESANPPEPTAVPTAEAVLEPALASEEPSDAPPRPTARKAAPKKTVRKSLQPAVQLPDEGNSFDDLPITARNAPPAEAPPPLPENHPLSPPALLNRPALPEPQPEPEFLPQSAPPYQDPALFNAAPAYEQSQSVSGYDQLNKPNFGVPRLTESLEPTPPQTFSPPPPSTSPPFAVSFGNPQSIATNPPFGYQIAPTNNYPPPAFNTMYPSTSNSTYPPASNAFAGSRQELSNAPELQPQPSNLQRSNSKSSIKGVLSSLRQSFSKKKSKTADESQEQMQAPSELGSQMAMANMNNSAFLNSQQAISMGLGASASSAQLAKSKSIGALSTRSAAGGPPQQCIVVMLDGDEVPFEVPRRALGVELANKVCDYLDLIERDYFGMTYTNQKFETWFWLHEDKPIAKQLKENAWVFRFQIKFYPPEPTMMKEELSRYQLCLQIRQDLYYGKLPCSWVTQALLGSYMVQSEMGDYDESLHGGTVDYLRSFAFVNGQSDELLHKIAELHRTHRGLTPSQADMRYLENAKRLELYGIDLHSSRDVADIEVQIGICYAGVVIYKDRLRLSRFAWPKILKISYKKDLFLLRIRTDRFESHLIDCAFRFANHKLTKRIWRYTVESHTFYRLKEPRKAQLNGAKSVTASMMSLISLGSARGSQFRYSGRTLHQARNETLGRSGPEAPSFERLASKRSSTGSMPNLSVAGSMSLTPIQQQANAAQAARSGSMMSLLLPPPRVGTVQTSRSMEMLNSGALGRSMTLPDGSTVDTRSQSKRDKEAARREKQEAARLAKEQREAAKREKEAAKRNSRRSQSTASVISESDANLNVDSTDTGAPQFDMQAEMQPSASADLQQFDDVAPAPEPAALHFNGTAESMAADQAAPRYSKRSQRAKKQPLSPQTHFEEDQIPQSQETVASPQNTAESPYAPLESAAVQQPARSQYAPSAAVALPRTVTPSLAPEPVASISLTGGRVTPLYAPSASVPRNVTPSISTEPVAAMPLMGGRATPLYAPAPAFAEMHAPPATFRPLSPASLQYAPPTSVSGPNQPFALDDAPTLTLQMPEEQPVLVAPVSFEMNVNDPNGSNGAPSQTVVKKTVRKVKKTAGTTGKKTAVPLQGGSDIV